MSEHFLDELDVSNRVLDRAQAEQFAFALVDGDVRVRNETYLDPADHEYLVTIQDGVPTACSCPADTHYESACKHRVAVAIRDAVVEAADRMWALADGGTQSDAVADRDSAPADGAADEHDCDCAALPDGVPCWPCYRNGREEFEAVL